MLRRLVSGQEDKFLFQITEIIQHSTPGPPPPPPPPPPPRAGHLGFADL